MSQGKYLPPANEFAPNRIDLFYCLEAVKNSQDRNDFIDTVLKQYFSSSVQTQKDKAKRLIGQKKLSGNVLIGLRGYLLVTEKEMELTAIGKKILEHREDAKNIFAKHLVDTLCGQELLICMDRLKNQGKRLRNKKHLANELNSLGITTKRGLDVSQTTTDHTMFATWLRWCGILDEKDFINEEFFHNVIGRSSGLTSSLWALTDQQFIFLKHFWGRYLATGEKKYAVKSLISDSKDLNGDYILRPDHVAKDIVKPLEKAGFLTIKRTSSGRGGNSGSIAPTKRISELTAKDLDEKNNFFTSDHRVTKPLAQIFDEIDSDDTHVKGLALEELSIVLGQSLGLKFYGFRTMSSETGGAEVDVIFEQPGIFYSKWLVQCKNTPKSQIQVSTIAKEVGNALVNTANGIIIVTSGTFTSAAVQYAEATMKKSNLQIHLIDGALLNIFKSNGTPSLVRKLLASSQDTARLRNHSVI